MRSEWKRISLRDAGVTLIDCDHRTPPAVDSGYPYVSIPQLRQGRIDINDARKITAEHFEEWTRKAKPQAYDVVLSRRCNPGETAFVAPHMEFALGQNLVLLRADGTKVHPPFLRWLVRSPDWWGEIERFINVGAVFNSLKCADIPKFSLPIPDLSEQQSIADTLGALDDKIALLRETNATLEAIAQALFKSWFVDFDPVRAKAEGRDPIGMPPEVADLFPSEFEDSELGEIPKGWGYVRVDSLYGGLYDGPHSTPAPSDTGPVFLGIKNFFPTRLDLSEVRHISEEDWPKWTRRVTPQAGDILFTYEATLGFFALVPEGLRCCLGRRTALVRPKSEMGNGPFLLHSFVSKPFQDLLVARRNHGSTVDRIPLTDFPSYPVLWPGERLARSFSDVVAPLWERIHRNQSQMQGLTEVRDILLPRLMSGKLRIPELQEAIEEAAA